MSINNLFIISPHGEVLLEKQWRGKVRRQVCELYWEEAGKHTNKDEIPSVINTSRYLLLHSIRYGLHFLTACDREVPPLLVFEIQHRIADILSDYMGGKLNESIIRENFSICLQLLDEIVDGGFPFTTELNQLKDMISPPSIANKLVQSVAGTFAVGQDLPSGAVSRIPWRKADVKYVTNEIYFDMIEQVDCIIGSNGSLVHCAVFGDVRCTCRLSGMPDLTLTFTKPSMLDDVSLHRCVRINRYLRERVVSFVPPDGVFKLLSYRVNGITQLPIYVKPTITYRAGSGRVHVMVGAKVAADKAVTDVAIVIPLPKSTQNTNLSANVGSVKYDQLHKVVRWEIGRLPRERTPMLEGTLTLPVDVKPEEAPTVRAEFQIKQYCVSGLKVDGLAVRGVKYKPFKGVRTITQGGKFQVRCAE